MAAFSAGFLREADDSLTVTTDPTGALYLDGFLRSPAGALVVTTSTAGATMQDGFLRAANGALVVNSGGAGTRIAGFLRDSNLALVVATSGGVVGRVAGFTRDASLRLTVTGLAFNPATIAGLQMWLKADALGLADGTPVTTWTRSDTSGLGASPTQATAANRPLFKTAIQNGQPALLFDGVNDSLVDLTANGFSVAQPDTIFIVAKNLDASATARQVLDSDGNVSRQVIYRETTDLITDYAGTAAISTGVSWGTTLFHYITITFNGASSTARVDGAAAAQAATPGASALAGLSIGSFNAGPGNFWSGYIAEVLIYNTALSAGNVTNVESYLKAKYGL